MLKKFLNTLFKIYFNSILFVIAMVLFVVGAYLPLALVITSNCNWWFLLYLISPLTFVGGGNLLYKIY